MIGVEWIRVLFDFILIGNEFDNCWSSFYVMEILRKFFKVFRVNYKRREYIGIFECYER